MYLIFSRFRGSLSVFFSFPGKGHGLHGLLSQMGHPILAKNQLTGVSSLFLTKITKSTDYCLIVFVPQTKKILHQNIDVFIQKKMNSYMCIFHQIFYILSEGFIFSVHSLSKINLTICYCLTILLRYTY